MDVPFMERWQSGRSRRLAKPLTGVYSVRGFESPPLRHLLVAAALALSAAGCVQRILRIETEPLGALVLLDGKSIGETPVDHTFQYFGRREILVEKDGFERRVIEIDLDGKWYDAFPFDFFTEFLPLLPRTDLRTVWLKLRPSARTFAGETDPKKEQAAREALLRRAEEMRRWVPTGEATKPRAP